MKNNITLLLAFLTTINCIAQSIKGFVKDQKSNPIPYVEVILREKEGQSLKSSITDNQGLYEIKGIKNANYTIEVYNFGEKVYTKELLINKNVNQDITIQKNLDLEEVIVVANKKLIDNKVDRLVFNVENSIASSGMDLTEALSITPMVIVGEQGISIAGKSGVSVMVNNKLLNISGADLINYLRSLRSDNISKIEVITTPPAKYDAQGNSGIINIVLKKNPKLGWSGNLSSTLAQRTYFGYTNNATINYKTEKINSSLKLRQFDRALEALEDIDVIGQNSVLSLDTRKDMYSGLGANLSIDYSINNKNTVGFIYDIGKIDDNKDIDNISEYKTNAVLDSTLTTISTHRNPTFSQTFNVYYDVVLGKKGQQLSFLSNYFENLPNSTVNFNTRSNINVANNTSVKNESEIDYNIWSIQSDLTLPTKWINVEVGVKYTKFNNTSDVRYLDFIANQFVIDDSKSNIFDYDEQNLAGYISFSKDLKKGWNLKTGLRYEYSIVDGISITTREKNSTKFGNLFPTFFLSYKPNDKHFYSFNYSRRINRPSFRALNPFRWYSNPFTYYTGNPTLRPSFNNNFELSYGYKYILSTKLYFQRLTDGYGRVVEVTNAGERIVDYDNFLTQNTVGFSGSLFLKMTHFWNNYLNLNTSYSIAESAIPEVVGQKGYAVYYSSNNSVTISKEKELQLLVNFWHQLPTRTGNENNESISSLSIGLRFPILNNKLRASIVSNDIFKGTVSRGEIFFSDFTQFYNNYYDARSLSINLTYNFGNRNVRGNNKRVKFDEKYRGN